MATMRRFVARCSSSLVVLCAACEPAPPSPATPSAAPSAVVSVPADSVSTSMTMPLASAAAPPSVETPPPPVARPDHVPTSHDPTEPATYPPGLVPDDLLNGLTDASEALPPPLANGESCARELHEPSASATSACEWDTPALVGFDAKTNRAAFLDFRPVDRRDGCGTAIRVIASLDKPNAAETLTRLAEGKTRDCPMGTSAPWAIADEVTRLAREGFVDPVPLVKLWAPAIFGAWAYHPLAVLRAPLRGYLLRAVVNRLHTRVSVELIAPDNKTVHVLGTTPLGARTCVEFDEKGRCAKSTTEQMPSVMQASLSPDRTRLVVMLKLNTPAGHDTSETFVRLNLAVPAGLITGS
jgi:hypothetical protein